MSDFRGLTGPKPSGVRLALAVALWGLIANPAPAQERIDPTVTQSVRPAPRLDRSESVTPSSTPANSDFGRALEFLNGGEASDALVIARALGQTLEGRVLTWAVLRQSPQSMAPEEIIAFGAANPELASNSYVAGQLEKSILSSDPTHRRVIDTLGGRMPTTLDGQIALAAAYIADGQTERAQAIARHIWVENFLSRDDEAAVASKLGGLLSNKDHWDRAVHLLMHDRASGTERIMSQLTPAQQSLARARIAVSRKASNTQALLDQVDPQFRDHSLFHFANAQFARDNGRLDAAIAHLNKAPPFPIDAAEFWYERRLIIRRLLAAGQNERAFEAARAYQDGPEGRVVEAHFHTGWIALSFLNRPVDAAAAFEKMTALSTLPESIVQSHFWLGRAHRAAGNEGAAQQAFSKAAAFPYLFYGQLAGEALGQTSISFRALPEWRGAEALFEARDLVKAVRLLDQNNAPELAEALMSRLIYQISTPAEFVLAARLAQDVEAHHLAIATADRADRRGTALDLFNFPRDGLPSSAVVADVDLAAVYAIARQESRFDVDAISRAGARGLMQLMPATAEEVARRSGLAYSRGRLTSDPAYNTRLGSAYLARQLDYYDGSLVLAAAAYNGGAGNVNKWIDQFGDPRQSNIDVVSWIEAIPFIETRKYVQRVMGNYLVYRARLGDTSVSPSTVLKRIAH